MKHWSFYDPQSGHFAGRTFSATDESALDINTPKGLAAIEGEHDHLSRRVDIATGLVVDHQPPAPNADYEWDDASKRWKLNAEVAAREERSTTARSRIAHLESNVQPRALREVALNRPKAAERLHAIDDEIAMLRRDIIG